VFESPVVATGKKPKPSRTWSEKTEPVVAVANGFPAVAVAVFIIPTTKKTVKNRLQPVATGYNYILLLLQKCKVAHMFAILHFRVDALI
jgi:hypothetical protein